MDPLETLAHELLAQGFHAQPHLIGRQNWAVELTCGIDVLEARIPRPRGTGSTQLDAIQNAQADLAEIRKRFG